MVSVPAEVHSYTGGRGWSRSCDAPTRITGASWTSTFLEGGPFTDQDVAGGSAVAVINAATRERFFGNAPAVGRSDRRPTTSVPGDRRRRQRAGHAAGRHGDIYVPFTTAKTDAYRQEMLGDFFGLLLAQELGRVSRASRRSSNRGSSRSRCRTGSTDRFYAPAETYFESVAGSSSAAGTTCAATRSASGRRWPWSALLFLLLPTVNLVNLNVSRIMERASEIGVRKAFGASSGTLVGQFVVENVC